jgi:hypothetical protein
MSNFLAIATVTAALREVLQPVVSNAVANAKVGFSRPDGSGAPPSPTVNVYLYQITPNAAHRNDDVPARRLDGTLAQQPQAAFDLHYLFTFHGDDAQLEPQRLLGAVASALHAQPVLSRAAVAKALADFTFLRTSNFGDQVERVRFTPTSLSLEEFSKLWSAFFQIEYSLSAVYQASVVLIESEDRPVAALPVQRRTVAVVPFRSPHIDRVVAQAGAEQPIVAGSTLLIQGQQLRGEVTLTLIDNQELVPADIKDAEVTLPLRASLRAGVKGVQVVHKLPLSAPPTLHRSFESNVAPFVLRPTITAISAGVPTAGVTPVTLTLSPNVGVGQRAVLILNNLSVSPPTAFTSGPVVSAADSNQITIGIAGVPTGTYLARVQIDGAESLLAVDSSNQFSGPTVIMP